MRRPVAETDARRLLSGGPVTLVTSAWHGKTQRDAGGVRDAAQLRPTARRRGDKPDAPQLRHDPLQRAVRSQYSQPSPAASRAVPGAASRGADVDKLELTKLPTFKATRVEAPLIEGCVAWIECGVEDALRTGDHVLFVGQVLAASAESEAFEDVVVAGRRRRRSLCTTWASTSTRCSARGWRRACRRRRRRATKSPEEAFEEQMEAAREEEEKREEAKGRPEG